MSNDSINVEPAKRISLLPPYLFAELDRMKAEVAATGMDIISLGIGDPDLPTEERVIERLNKAARNPQNHQYPSYEGMLSSRKAVTDWYNRRFGVTLDPATEAVTLIGSKEGVAHIPFAFVNPGDVVLVPDPGYPVYQASTVLAGGTVHFMPLLEENSYLPNLKAIPKDVLKKAKLMFLNYPNNPTAAIADKSFFDEVVLFAKEHNIIVCHDAAYSEMAYDGYKPCSFMEADGAKDVGVEFHSLSKTYNMTGWRIGSCVGNAKVIAGLGKIKTNIDSGVFQAIQEAGIEALEGNQDGVSKMQDIYKSRRDLLVEGLCKIGLKATAPKATFYIWFKAPEGYTSQSFTAHILTKTGVVITPGVGFGPSGEGYVRMALTVNEARLTEALERIKKVGW